MDAIPLTWLVSVLLAIAAYVLSWNEQVPRCARILLCAFLLCLVVVSLLLGMRVTTDQAWPGLVQPFFAVLAAPLAYLGFASLTVGDAERWRNALIRNGALVGLALVGIALPLPISADVFILSINAIYLVALAGLLRLGPDDFAAVPPNALHLWLGAIYATLALLGLMILADGFVFVVSLLASQTPLAPLLTGVSGVFVGFVLVLALIGLPLLMRRTDAGRPALVAPTDEDQALVARADEMMERHQLYRDSGLTLTRMARRLTVPDRTLSGAINRVTKENVSRYINAHRIAYAKHALTRSSLPVTEVMLEAGFLSKSSFNTEFRRVTGSTPSQYRANAKKA